MKPSARRKARRMAVQALYQWQMTGAPVNDIQAQFLAEQSTDNVDVPYFHELLEGVVRHADEMDAVIAPYSEREMDQMDLIEKAILRLTVFELSKRPDVPYRVVINEGIELAKAFGAEDSHKFVNGVLDKAVSKLRPGERGGRQ